MIAVIDGPAGSGKSSTAKEVAKRCNLEYVDTGALYRTCALLYLKFDDTKGKTFLEYLQSFKLNFTYGDKKFSIFVDNHDVTETIRNVNVSECVSSVSAMPEVRKFVNNLIREAARERNVIADGRDLGSQVFPEADFKFYMVADIHERAKRRFQDMKDLGMDVTLEEVKENIKQRDLQDSTRTASPLVKADDAIEIDTTNLMFNEQVERICNIINHT